MQSCPHRALAGAAVLALAVTLVAPAAAAAGASPSNHAGAPSAAQPSSDGLATAAPPTDRSATGTVDLVVRPAAGGGRRAAAASVADGARRAVADIAGASVSATHRRSGVAVVSVDAGRVERATSRLAAQPGIGEVQRDQPVRAFATERASIADHGDAVTPDDPLYPEQWAPAHVDAPLAWGHTLGAETVTVAVLDTGVDADHPDLAGAVAGGINVSGDGPESDHDDVHGHGTHVAGVAAARTGNATGVAGLCGRCSILSVKVLDDDGGGGQADVAEGVRWAVDAGADVIVMSFGGDGASTLLADAVTEAHQAGVIMVAAAGNAGTDTPKYPAAFPEVIGVGAVDDADARAAFSNHGDWVALAAPGVSLAGPTSDPNQMSCDAYCLMSGTSAAAPVVAGVAALGLAVDAGLDAGDVRQALAGTAVDVGGWLADGRVDAGAAIGALARAADDGSGGDGSGDDGSTDDGSTDDGSTDDGSTDDGSSDDGSGGDGDGSGDDGDGSGDGGSDDGSGDDGSSLSDGTARTGGSQRFATAAALSAQAFEPGVERVYVATGGAFADALAAGAAAGAVDGPVLLTARDTLPAATRDELARLVPAEVVAVGGPAAISGDVADSAARAAGAPLRRLAGEQRFATAAAIARDAFDPDLDTAYVATGEGFADALAGVPAAAADGAPMLLTGRDRLPPATRDALAALSPARIVVLGGPAAVATGVADDLAGLAGDGGVQRVAGEDRFATAAAVAERFDAAPAAFLATGWDFPDALAGGPVAAHHASPLLLAAGDQLPAATRAQLERLGPAHVRLLGGVEVLGEELVGVLEGLLGGLLSR